MTVRRRLDEEEERLERLTREARRALDGSPAQGVVLDASDWGTSEVERAQQVAILAQAEGDLRDVREAIRKLAEGTYGRCEACGAPIVAERLRARPAARFCIDDQRRSERLAGSAA